MRVDGVSNVTGALRARLRRRIHLHAAGWLRSGTEVFAYNIADADGLGAVVPGFVTFNVSSNIWFIDNSRSINGDGSLANPFNSLADVNGAGGSGDVDAAR